MDHQAVSASLPDPMLFTRAGAPARAVVSAGGVDTHYLRAGAGNPVVLLTEAHGDASAYAAFATLVRGARVIAPYIPANICFTEWLRDFLDGLGLSEVTLVADEPMASQALEFAAGDRMRVSTVLLLVGGLELRADEPISRELRAVSPSSSS